MFVNMVNISLSRLKAPTAPHLTSHSNTSLTPHREHLPLRDEELIPVKDVDVRRGQQTRMNRFFSKDDTHTETQTDRSMMNERIKKQKINTKVIHTVSDTYVHNGIKTFYRGPRIPATRNVQRKTCKAPRSLRATESRDTVRTGISVRKKKLPTGIQNKIVELKQRSRTKMTKDDVTTTSIVSNKKKRANRKITRNIPRSQQAAAAGGGGEVKRVWNSDLVEIYHNKKVKALTESNSDNSVTFKKIGSGGGHKRPILRTRNTIRTPLYRTYQKYPMSYMQQNYLRNVENYTKNETNMKLHPAKVKYPNQYYSSQSYQLQQEQGTTTQPFQNGTRSQIDNFFFQPTKIQTAQYQNYNNHWNQKYYQNWQRSQYDVPNNNTDSYSKTLEPIEEKPADINYMPKTYYTYQERHYQLPTISSRLKQVTRSYLQQFNVKTIPFVTASSTTPSHNLGLNIQQVLSIMKTHQPISGISPTLAHNMGLVAQSDGSFVRGTEDAITNILSRMSSRQSCLNTNRRSTCPLLRQATAVVESELCDVPEHPCEETAAEAVNTECHLTAIPPAGNYADPEITKREVTEWDQANPPAQKQKCTCFPRKGTNCNRIFHQYMNQNLPIGNNLTPIAAPPPGMVVAQNPVRAKQYKSAFSMRSTEPEQQGNMPPPAENQPLPLTTGTNNLKPPRTNTSKGNFHSQLAGKMRGLRDVLANLHDDFQKMNDRYDELSEQVRNNAVKDPDAIKQLAEMEKELNAKEEEITVVISLYKEVLALKEQVRTLKERTSMLSMSVYSATPSMMSHKQSLGTTPTVTDSYHGNGEQTVNLRLTKLLHQIQHFQGLLRQHN